MNRTHALRPIFLGGVVVGVLDGTAAMPEILRACPTRSTLWDSLRDFRDDERRGRDYSHKMLNVVNKTLSDYSG